MAKVVIVGAGGVGRVVAHTCARYPKVFETLLLASRSEHKCKAIAQDVLQKHNYAIQTAAWMLTIRRRASHY